MFSWWTCDRYALTAAIIARVLLKTTRTGIAWALTATCVLVLILSRGTHGRYALMGTCVRVLTFIR